MATSLRPSVNAAAPEPFAALRRAVPARPPLVLVVDDHDDTRFLLRTLLEIRGVGVAEAEDGVRALETAERVRPDLILMDGSLPRLDGFAATRRIRENALLRGVPVIFISAHAGDEFRRLAFVAGCDDYIVKPFQTAELDRLLARHLSRIESGSPRIEL